LEEMIKEAYSKKGYCYVGDTENGMKFTNLFSRHFIFCLSDVLELQEKWHALHKEVIQEYLDFKEESFLEWNFYCVFILKTDVIKEEESRFILQVEQDRSYSRKYVRLSNDLEMLPPGWISIGEIGDNEMFSENLTKHWREHLDGDLYSMIMDKTKSKMEDNLKELLEVKNG